MKRHDVLSDLMKIGSGGSELHQAFDHDNLELGGKRRDRAQERYDMIKAKQIAQKSANILRQQQLRCQRNGSSVHIPTFTGMNGSFGSSFGSRIRSDHAGNQATSLHSSAILERIRMRAQEQERNSGGAAAPEDSTSSSSSSSSSVEQRYSAIMLQLRDFLRRRQNGDASAGVPSDDILQEFGARVRETEAAIFKAILKQTAVLRNGLWYPR